MGPLIGLGIGFLTDLISKHGETLVTEGVKAVTGIDLNKKELTAEDKKLILDAEFRLKELDFKSLELSLNTKKEDNRHEETNAASQASEYDSARGMQQEALRQEDKFSKRFIYYFAAYWSLMATGYLFAITFTQIPETSVRFADTTVGFLLGTVVSTIIGFFYGNSLKKESTNIKGA